MTNELLEKIFTEDQIISTRSLSGGCINDCYQVVTNKQPYFIKLNKASRFPKLFECEAFSLDKLSATKSINVPKVIRHGVIDDNSFLLLEYIEQGNATSKSLAQLGYDLATLHKNTNERFGWNENNYLGSLIQNNNWSDDWHEFYWQHILPLISTKSFSNSDVDQCKIYLETNRKQIPTEPPSLLHGDLWSGNYLISSSGNPYVIDPACYYGHREIDIAMTQLFGGFGNDFINAYNETYPLEKNWKQWLNYFQLYPLLVHAVLFGGGYVENVKRIISFT